MLLARRTVFYTQVDRMHYQTRSHDKYAHISATGEYDFRQLFSFIEHLKAETDRLGARRLLVDCSELQGQIPEVDRFEGGQKVAEVFGPFTQIALVLAPGTVTKLGELAAVNRGAHLLVTDDHAEAENWLTGQE